MPPRKRKPADQPSLEDVTDQPVKVSKSRKGDLAHPKKEVKPKQAPAKAEQEDEGQDLFLKRRARKTGVQEAPPLQKPEAKPAPKEAAKGGAGSDAGIWVNRAPVLTLWAALVAQRQGYSREAGLSFGKAIAGMMAQSKGRSIGIYEKHDKDDAEASAQHDREAAADMERADVFGMKVKALKHGSGGDVRAMDTGEKPVDAAKVQSYLERAFGPRLADAERALQGLAESYDDPGELAKSAYDLYSEFRQQIPTGQTGWGKKGLLDLQQIAGLHKKQQEAPAEEK